jgi:hypothetical protein
LAESGNTVWSSPNTKTAAGAVLEVVVNTFFFAQALDEMQVGFVVLHAVVAIRARLAELEAVGVALMPCSSRIRR